MATSLEASLRLRDQFTAVLKKIDSSLKQSTQAMETFKEKAAGPAQAMNKVAQAASLSISKLNSSIKNGMSTAGNVVKSSTERILSLFGNFGNRISSKLKLDGIKNKFGSAFESVKSKISSSTSAISSVVGNLGSKIASSFSKGVSAVKSGATKMAAVLKQAGSSFKQFGSEMKNSFDKMGSAIDPIATKIGNFMKKAALAGGVALIGLGKKVYDVAGAFDSQMSRVKAISGATGGAFDKMRAQAIELGAKTAFSATESAAGMENLASAGFNAQEIMSAMPGLLDLAAVSGGDVALASENAATALRGFNMDASQAGHVANVFARAAADTNAEVADMGEAMKYVAPVANSMGLSIEEVAASIGIMSDAGVKGSQAGTTLRGALSRLAKPTDPMIDKMKELGLKFYDAKGQMKPLTQQVGMLQKAFKGLTPEQQQNALVTLYGQESLSGMMALVAKGPKALSKLTSSLKNSSGAAAEMAETMQDNIQSKMEQLGGAVESGLINIGDRLFPIVGPVIEKFTSFLEKKLSADSVGKFFDKLQKYGDVVKNVFDNVKGPVSDAATAIGDSLEKITGKFGSDKNVSGFQNFAEGIGNGIKSIAEFAEKHADTIAKLISLLPKLAAAFVGFKIGSSIVGTIATFGSGLATAASAAKNLVKNLAKIKGPKTPSTPNTPSTPTSGVPDSSGPINAAGNAASAAAKKMLAFGAAALMVGGAIALAAVGMKLMADAAISLANSGGAATAIFFGMLIALAALVAVFAVFGSALTAGAVGMLAFGATMLMIGAALAIATPGLQALPPVILALGIAFSMAAASVASAVAVIAGAIGSLVVQIASSLSQIALTIGVVLVSVIAQAGNSISQIISTIGEAASQIVTSVGDLLAQLGDSLSQVIESIATGIAEITSSVAEGIATVVDSVGGAISGVLDSLAGVFESIGTAALNAGTGMGKMADALARISSMGAFNLVKTVGALGKALGDLTAHSTELSTVGEAMGTLASSMMQISAAIQIFSSFGVVIAQISTSMETANTSSANFSSAITIIAGSVGTAVGPLLLLATTSQMVSATLIASIAGMLIFNSQVILLASSSAIAAAGLVLLVAASNTVSSQVTALNAVLIMLTVTMALIVTTFQNGANQMATAMTQGMTLVRMAAISGMAAFNVAVSSGLSAATATVRAGVSQMVSAVQSIRGQMFSAGSYAMSGLAAGIQSGAGAAISAAQSVANQVSAAVRSAMKIHSPSRVMMDIGEFVSAGLAKGILTAQNLVSSASNTLAGAAIPNKLATVSANGDVSSNLKFEPDEVESFKRSGGGSSDNSDHRVYNIEISINVDNADGEPIDEDALANKTAKKIIEALDSDLN